MRYSAAFGITCMLALMVGSCGTSSRENVAKDWPALADRAGIVAPAVVQILIDDREARAEAEGHELWIAKAAQPFLIGSNPPPVAIPSGTVFRALDVYLRSDDLGVSTASESNSFDWTNAAGAWRAYFAQSSTGHLLYLEFIAVVH